MKTILQARFALLLNHPWLATALLRLPLVEVTDARLVPTLATDGHAVFYHPEFCASLTAEELQFCVAHELMHCVLDHVPRMGARQPTLWNVAVDLVTNRLLEKCGFTVPAGALHAGSVELAVDNRTAEQIYDALAGPAQGQQAQTARWLRLREAAPLADGHGGTADVIAKLAALRPDDAPAAAEMAGIRAAVIRDSAGRHRGWERGTGVLEIGRAGLPRVPWRDLLAAFLTGLQKNDYRWFPPAKRHLWRGMMLPSTTVSGPAHVVVAIDTSGSMSGALLQRILAEIDEMRRQWSGQLTILDCDAAVQNVRVFEPFDPVNFDSFGLKGRGGTSFEPVFEWLETQSESMTGPAPDVLIYFTDGYGTYPEDPPDLPVCWIMPDSSAGEVPFGQLILLDVHD
jgi:predicted metal-dependent peptidase